MSLNRKQLACKSHHPMPVGTRDFLQKICYKETASVDMTRHGFINDNHPIRLFLKPLRKQIEKIHGHHPEYIERNNSRTRCEKIINLPDATKKGTQKTKIKSTDKKKSAKKIKLRKPLVKFDVKNEK